jgi:preprotein translocase subunit SecF
MRLLRLVPTRPNLDVLRHHNKALVLSFALVVASIALAFVPGLNFGIDFRGGTVIEIRTEDTADIPEMRTQLGGLGLGEVSLQRFGNDTDVLIRIQKQETEDQTVAILKVKEALGSSVEYRRTEFVGPTVGDELKEAGFIAVVCSLLAIMAYIWFRFEWQFSVGAIAALMHDVLVTVGLFAITGMEFNLATVAAVLTIAGYSINDTVVVYDRVRENLRRYKRMSMPELLNLSINETLSRTVMTSVTTLLALVALAVFGGEVIRGFCIALIWGVVIGTYSSIYLAVPALLWTKVMPVGVAGSSDDGSSDEGAQADGSKAEQLPSA